MKNSKIYYLEQKSEHPESNEEPDQEDLDQQLIAIKVQHHFVSFQIVLEKNWQDQELILHEGLQWKRANEVLEGELQLFGEISPNDVMQGYLKNQTFLSVLASLAMKPANIKKLFKNIELELDGKYCVYICGQEIKVDDKFPINDQNQFNYAKPVKNKLWVMLLEKAYALYYGSYFAIEGGSPRIAIKDILQTKKVTHQIKSFTPEALWDLIKFSIEKGLIILVSTNAYYATSDHYRSVSYSDCYSVLNIKLKDEDEKFQAIQFKNLQENEFIFHNIDSEKGFNQPNDGPGMFWMYLEDFQKCLDIITIGEVEQGHKQIQMPLQFDKEEQVTTKLLQISFLHPTNAFIEVSQIFQDFRSSNFRSQKSLILLIIGKLHPITKEVISVLNTDCRQSEAYVERTFEIGVYVIYIEVDWGETEKKALSIFYDGDQDQVEIKEFEIKKEKTKLYTENIFDGLIRAHALNQGNIGFKEYAKDIQCVHGKLALYYYNWYFNKTNNITLYEKIEMQNMQNIEICPPFNNNNIISIICRPQSNSLVKFRVTRKGVLNSFMFASKVQSSLIQERSEEEIIKSVLLKPDQRKTIRGEDQIEAVLYHIGFQDGLALVFENEENKLFKTNFYFQADNLKGINFEFYSGKMLIVVPSKSRKVLQFQQKDPFDKFLFDWVQIESLQKIE